MSYIEASDCLQLVTRPSTLKQIETTLKILARHTPNLLNTYTFNFSDALRDMTNPSGLIDFAAMRNWCKIR